MPIEATIVLDSGTFLPKTDRFCDVGYFQSEDNVSDIKIFVDGEEVDFPQPFKLCESKEKKCRLHIFHKDGGDIAKPDGITVSRTFHSQLLHLKDLYNDEPKVAGKDNHQHVEENNFDCVLRFHSGHFCASMVKNRAFKEHKMQSTGLYKHDPKDKPKTLAVSHNVVIHFTLEDGEALELVRDSSTLWSSKKHAPKRRIEIEIVADNSTAEKFSRHSFSDDKKASYWLPNQGDPPPTCPSPPCPESP